VTNNNNFKLNHTTTTATTTHHLNSGNDEEGHSWESWDQGYEGGQGLETRLRFEVCFFSPYNYTCINGLLQLHRLDYNHDKGNIQDQEQCHHLQNTERRQLMIPTPTE
jgi:hypothetical protein